MNGHLSTRTFEQERSARYSLSLACVGHAYSHLFSPIFFTLVPLALEKELGLSHGETVTLIFAGNALFGFAAPLAGWLADKWSTTGMMALFYLGTGSGMVMAGLASSSISLGFWLGVTGLFASIYHPVGIAWLVRESINTGTVLGINGVFGSLGTALATVMTGWLMYAFGWRAAYILPGIVVILTGIAFMVLLLKGIILESKMDRKPPPPPVSRSDTIRVYLILVVTMCFSGIIYQATNPAMPKAFAIDFSASGEGILTVTYLLGLVYTIAGIINVVGGRLADIYPARYVYLLGFLLQVPALMLFGMSVGASLVVVAMFMTGLNNSTQPAENILIARYTPLHRRGLIFGMKFVIAIGIASLGVILEGMLFDLTGNFFWLFIILGSMAAFAACTILLLPRENLAAVPQPAE